MFKLYVYQAVDSAERNHILFGVVLVAALSPEELGQSKSE